MKKISNTILRRALLKNFFNIVRFYPGMILHSKFKTVFPITSNENYIKKLSEKVLSSCKISVQVYGAENIPKEEGIYICSNHQQKFDPLAIWKCFPHDLGVVIDDTVTHRPIISEFCKIIPCCKISNENKAQSLRSLKNLIGELENKKNYMIFPEGEYDPHPSSLLKFKDGAFKVALKSKTTILPVAIVNSYKALLGKWSDSYTIQVHFLEPLTYEQYKNLKATDISRTVRNSIQEVLNTYQH